MKTNRLVMDAFRMLNRHKVRTAFMMLGTFVGVAALTVVVALGQGAQQQVLESFRRVFAGSRIMLTAVAESHGDMRTGSVATLTIADLDAIEASISAVTMVDPLQYVGSADLVYDGDARRTAVRGYSERYPIVANRGVTRGSFFEAADVRAAARVAVVGETLVERVFGGSDPIGKTVRIGTVPFQVIGVLAPLGLDPHGVDRDNEVIVPISTMMRRVMNVDYLNSGTILVDESADLEATVTAIEALLRDRHGLGPSQPNDFRMWTPVQVEKMIQSSNRVFTVFLPLVALVSIVIGAAVVANVMLVAVTERRGEIGLRKALGARSRDIGWQFMLESTFVTTLGGVAAILVGLAALQVLSRRADLAIGFPWVVTSMGMAIAVTVGVVAGILPARRAARLDPVESLR